MAANGSAADSTAILLMIDGLQAVTPGGTERQALQFAMALHEGGYRVVVYVLRGMVLAQPGEYPFEILYGGIPSLASLRGIVRLLGLVRWMKRERFQMVQTFLLESNLAGPVLARLAGVPFILGHRRNTNHWMSRSFALAQSFSNRFTNRLLANCERVKDFVVQHEGVRPEKVDILYSGIEVQRFARDPDARAAVRGRFAWNAEHIVVGTVATLRPIKGLAELMRAAVRVTTSDPRVRFLLVGDGPLRMELEKEIREMNLTNRVYLAGGQEDVAPFLQAMDIAVLPSRAEGFSNALLECMAAGLPTVATDVGGNREALGEDAGRLVEAGRPDELARAILEFAASGEMRLKFGSAARERASRSFDAAAARGYWVEYVRRQLRATADR